MILEEMKKYFLVRTNILPMTQTAQPDERTLAILDFGGIFSEEKEENECLSSEALGFNVKHYRAHDLISCPAISPRFGLLSPRLLKLLIEFKIELDYERVDLYVNKTEEKHDYFMVTGIKFQDFIDTGKSSLKNGCYSIKTDEDIDMPLFRDRFNFTHIYCNEDLNRLILASGITGISFLEFKSGKLSLFSK